MAAAAGITAEAEALRNRNSSCSFWGRCCPSFSLWATITSSRLMQPPKISLNPIKALVMNRISHPAQCPKTDIQQSTRYCPSSSLGINLLNCTGYPAICSSLNVRTQFNIKLLSRYFWPLAWPDIAIRSANIWQYLISGLFQCLYHQPQFGIQRIPIVTEVHIYKIS